MYRVKIVKAGYLPFHEILSRVILFCFVRVSLTGSKLVVLAVRVDFVTRACLLSRASLRNIYIYIYIRVSTQEERERSSRGTWRRKGELDGKRQCNRGKKVGRS